MAHHQCCYGSRSVAPAGGFPVAVQLASRYGDVAMPFRLGGQLERVRPWFDHTPPLAS